jgi:hypothetical protein
VMAPDASFYIYPNPVGIGKSTYPITLPHTGSGFTYTWTLLPGTTNATLFGNQGTSGIGIAAGNQVGTFTLQLTVKNSVGYVATSSHEGQVVE